MPRDQVTEIVCRDGGERAARRRRRRRRWWRVGDAVVLLESMKMEIPVFTEVAGVVRAVKVSRGDVVQEGDVLVEIVPS